MLQRSGPDRTDIGPVRNLYHTESLLSMQSQSLLRMRKLSVYNKTVTVCR